MTTTDPTGMTALDTEPANAYRAELLAKWLIDGRGQNMLAAREYAKRRFQMAYDGKQPSKKQWSRAYALAVRM